MAEPQPDTMHEGVDFEDETPSFPKSAEDRKAAAALNSVAAARDDDDLSSGPAKEVDQEALGRAMKNLDVTGVGGVKSRAKDGDGGAPNSKEGDERKKAAVRVDPADVALLVSGI